MRIDNVEVFVEGDGPKTIVMVHGWPDTYRLWDAQVEALKDRYRCVRFTLPGFDLSQPGRAYSLDEVVETIRRVVSETSDGQQVSMLLHDWGCLYGYQFVMRYPDKVERVIGVDIGDGGSRRQRAELNLMNKLMVVGYQVWLALAWRIGGRVGDAMARGMARILKPPADPGSIGAQMGYPYAATWLGAAGGFHGLKPFIPRFPMLYIFGERKPFMFHSQGWIEVLARRPGSRVLGLPTGHWVMAESPQAFNEVLLQWLAETDELAVQTD